MPNDPATSVAHVERGECGWLVVHASIGDARRPARTLGGCTLDRGWNHAALMVGVWCVWWVLVR
jgi:hypothetical protein